MPFNQQQIEEITALFHEIDGIKEVTFSTEQTVDGSPAEFRLTPENGVSKERLEDIARRGRNLVDDLIDAEIKASLEHPFEAVINSNGKLINHIPVESQYYISIRWNEKMTGTPSDVRVKGEPVPKVFQSGHDSESIKQAIRDTGEMIDADNETVDVAISVYESHQPELDGMTKSVIAGGCVYVAGVLYGDEPRIGVPQFSQAEIAGTVGVTPSAISNFYKRVQGSYVGELGSQK